MSAIDDIASERRRQIDVEGWTPEHDDAHRDGVLARAAACYADPHLVFRGWTRDGRKVSIPDCWPWEQSWWKPTTRRRDLVKAAALIVAEIERLDREGTQRERQGYDAVTEAVRLATETTAPMREAMRDFKRPNPLRLETRRLIDAPIPTAAKKNTP